MDPSLALPPPPFLLLLKKKMGQREGQSDIGIGGGRGSLSSITSCWTRTNNLLLRRQMLYHSAKDAYLYLITTRYFNFYFLIYYDQLLEQMILHSNGSMQMK